MEIFYTIMAFARPILLIVAIVLFTKFMLGVARRNHERRRNAINQLFDYATGKDKTEKDE